LKPTLSSKYLFRLWFLYLPCFLFC